MSPFTEIWGGCRGDGDVHNEALGVFCTVCFHTGWLRGMPALCVESRSTQSKAASASLSLRGSTELCGCSMGLKEKGALCLTCWTQGAFPTISSPERDFTKKEDKADWELLIVSVTLRDRSTKHAEMWMQLKSLAVKQLVELPKRIWSWTLGQPSTHEYL